MAKNAIARWSNPEVILVATSLLEDHSLMQHAIFQARLSKAAVLLVHVIPPSYLITETNCPPPFVLPSPALRVIRAKLDEIAKEFQRVGITCEPIVLKGLPEEEIPSIVKSRSVDRVIVATRNTSGVARLIVGSVAEELIDELEVPVCVIGRHAHMAPSCGAHLRRVLVAASLQPNATLPVAFAMELAEANGSHFTLLHVIESEIMGEQQLHFARMEARQRLCDLVPNEAKHSIQTLLLIREGDPATIILEEAGSLSEDIVILGSPHSSTAFRLLSSSIAHRVILESECPVITIKATLTSESEKVQDSTRSSDADSILAMHR